MLQAFEPVLRQGLADDVAKRIVHMIVSRGYEPGARLPAISRMASDFAVGAPTVREALKRLETVGAVTIRHGSGVYVGRSADTLLISNPVFEPTASKKLLVDLIEARIPIETSTARLAAVNATDAQLAEMGMLLERAGANIGDASMLSEINMSFHEKIAVASGNSVLRQILHVMSTLFRIEQRIILDIHGRREDDRAEHLGILRALVARDASLATRRMDDHLTRVRDVLMQWNPERDPVR